MKENGLIEKVKGRNVFFTDKNGVTHKANGAEVHRGVNLFWTLCEKDIPANEGFTMRDGDDPEITCTICKSEASHD